MSRFALIAVLLWFHSAAFSFPCRDKTPKEFADVKVNRERKIIEASIRVSATFAVAEDQVDRIEYRLKMPEFFEICDYLPQTKLDTNIVGPVAVGRGETAKSLTVVAAEGGGGVKFDFVNANVSGKASTEKANEVTSNVQMSLVPPKQLVTMTSTQDGGRTLLFKLKPFSLITLEGDKDFAFLAAVPKDWKGDCFTLECAAFLKGSQTAAAKKSFMIGLYSSGDLVTKKQVEAIAKAKAYQTAATQRPRPKKTITTLNGRYRFIMTAGHFGQQGIDATYKPDGTWEGWLRNVQGTTWQEFAASQVRGTWSIDNNELTIIHNQTSVYGATSWFKDGMTQFSNEPIVSYDDTTGVIVLKSGSKIEPVK
jgi:hypothetical protein